MKIILFFAMVVWSCHASFIYDIDDAENLFEEFIKEYSKVYESENEKQIRFNIFVETLKLINSRNQQQDGAEHRLNMLSDLTQEEIATQFKGLTIVDLTDGLCPNVKSDADIPDANAPESWDWRSENVLAPIKNQLSCGACWAFSTIATVESAYAKKNRDLISLSEQQLVDCDNTCNGCNGCSNLANGFEFLSQEGGSETEQEYPFTSIQGTCNFQPNEARVRVTTCTSYNLQSTDDKIKQLLYANGPISIGIKATAVQTYHGGILSAVACDVGQLDHAVNLVGYGSENGKKYWIVRNSWGTTFGENGYFRMERGEGINTCGFVNNAMTSADVA